MNQQRFSITAKDSYVDGRQKKFELNLHDNLSINNSQRAFAFDNISRSIPVVQPRVEIAHSYNDTNFSPFEKSNFLDYQTEKLLNHNQQFYSVEEHHDDFSLREPDTADYRHLSITIPDNHFNDQIRNSKLAEEVNLLITSHSNPSVNLHSQDIADRTRNHLTQNPLKFFNLTKSTDQFPSDIQRTDSLPCKKPQIYHAENRLIKRLTYHPTGSQHTHVTYPVVELSIPKGASIDDALIDVPFIDQDINWHYLSRNNSDPNNYQAKYQTNTSPTNGSISLISSKYDRSFSSGEQTASSNIQSTSKSTQVPIVDYSSLDALLDESLLQDKGNMSKSTKEWRSSFSTMRNRFGNTGLLSEEEILNNYDFATNGSMTLPKRALAKSASQGNLTINEHLDSSGRRPSLLANAVERRHAAEAPELQRPASRRELGNFWEATIKGRSVTPRISSPLTAAQRMELLDESVSETGTSRLGRRFSGDNLARRKANFLEAVKSSSPQMDHVTIKRSTVIPPIETKENSINGGITEPNFASLDSAVAELNSNYALTRNGGCAKFPLYDLPSSSPVGKREALTSFINGALLAHSPSPEATSDTSSSYNAPSGLPHPKPKHNIREQLIQAGFEPRGTAIYVNRSGVRFGSAPNFPVPSNGSVASRISEFERRPGAPNLLRIACALTGTERQRNEVSPIRSPLGPMSPRSSVYRTKPIIHADISGTSLRVFQPSADIESVFQFPQSKQLVEAKEEIPYQNNEDTPTTATAEIEADNQLKIIELQETTNFVLQPPIKSSKFKSKISDQNEDLISYRSIAERRMEKKSAITKTGISKPCSNASNGKALQNGIKVESKWPTTPPLPKVQVVDVPRFFFPKGVPISISENDAALRRVSDIFNAIGNKVRMTDMAEVCRAAGIPIYWKRAVYDSCCNNLSRPITLMDFASWWNRMTAVAHDEAARFVYTLAGPHRNYLIKEDLAPILKDLIETFPGLHFLREAEEFHSRYVETVIVRIFWAVNRSWTGRITINELRRSNFLETVKKLETTDDINAITNYFSYEHFYVIYCKFYELDKDHDLIISKIDMSQHCNGALPPQIIDRIFSGAVTRSPAGKRIREALETIGYTDFVAFLLAEEDKRHPTSVEYWFRCLDLDGDGVLSMYEMEYFYNGVKNKMDQHNIDSMRFDDVVCNLLDLIRPKQPNVVSLSDLKKCPLCTRFFNTFVNWVKYYEQEANEGERATVTDGEEELNDWDRYCLEEYEALMADDQDNDELEDINLNLDDDDDLLIGSNVNTTVNLSLREFGDSQRTKILEAI
ncbi:EF hand family protein [Loa loa]|uniref:EF hand family protein n=1 Tax=Loa loa TaxID=7209 RepID=A0A1S0ULW5_LOALO|nr:EF hand family protein [Loa loa]EJD76416.1 EF hand family protein [Loa loa]